MIDKAKLAEWRARLDEGMLKGELADLAEEAMPALLDEVERLRVVIVDAADRLSPLGERSERYLRKDLADAVSYTPIECLDCGEGVPHGDALAGESVCEGCD